MTDADREVSRPTLIAREYVRAKILLLKVRGDTNAAAEKLDATVSTVRLRVHKFEQGDVEAALANAPIR